jgi:monoamine oxidase
MGRRGEPITSPAGAGVTDVIIVGAGLSGLMAARRVLKLHGTASVVVLEARDRVGGRMFAQHAGGERKGWVDLGGQWLGEGQARIRALVKELGLDIFEQYADGPVVLWYDGRRFLDDSKITAPSDPDRKAAEDLLEALSQAADLVVPDASQPWASPLAPAYDRLTLGEWIYANSDHDYARFFAGMAATFDQAGGSPWEVSLLHSLFEQKANPAAGEPDKYYIRGAAGQIPPLLSRQLGGDQVIQLNSRVVAIHQASDEVTVAAVTPQGYKEYRGKALIVAIPPLLTGAISYTSSVPGQPGLPARRMHLTQRMAMGTIAKIACVYDTPWWRTTKERLSGTSFSKGRLVGFTADSGLPGDEGPGVLTSFIQGEKLFDWVDFSLDRRKQSVIRDLVDIFGEDARNPADYVEALWPQDQLTGGAYNAYLPPGGWTSYGSTLREPFGRISWAGTETATEWYGYFDGAATAGERAAKEILNRWF